MLFKHGQIVATPGALILAENGVNLLEYLEPVSYTHLTLPTILLV